MKRAILLSCLVLWATLVIGCGSTSSLRSSAGEKLVCDKQFDCVQVATFKSTVAKTDAPATKIDWACGQFADLIVQELQATGAFRNVSRVENVTDADDASLIISGEVTRYREGNAFARFMIGFGAGSSYFDAIVRFAGGADREEIGIIKVDRHSWVLGGGYASSQTPETYMGEAAKKIAAETKRLARSQ
jgi:hypothetical protein